MLQTFISPFFSTSGAEKEIASYITDGIFALKIVKSHQWIGLNLDVFFQATPRCHLPPSSCVL